MDVHPSIQSDRALYRRLRHALRSAGCFEHAPGIVFIKLTVLATVVAGAFGLLLTEPGILFRLLLLAVLGAALAQCGFMAHDSVHRTLVRGARANDALGQCLLSFLSGLSYSYFFKHNHLAHHAYCGQETKDPEMESDLLALYASAARAKSGFARFTSRHQAWLLWLLLTLNTFSLRVSGLAYILQYPDRTRWDQLAIALHAVVWLVVPTMVIGFWGAFANYLILTWLIGLYLTGIFPFYHVGRETRRAGQTTSFLRQQTEATRNVSASVLAGLYTGGTNNHIEHHLFPAIPTARLRRARPIIRRFCRDHGVPYEEARYRDAVREITRRMAGLQRLVPRSQGGR